MLSIDGSQHSSSSKPYKQMLETANFAPRPKVMSCVSSEANVTVINIHLNDFTLLRLLIPLKVSIVFDKFNRFKI